MNIERIKDFKTFQRLKKEWNELLFSSAQNSLFLTHEWLSAWWNSFSNNQGYSMEILLFKEENGTSVGIAPLMFAQKRLCFIASHEVSDYCDFFMLPQSRVKFYTSLMRYFKDHFSNIRKVELINIRSRSPTLSLLPRQASENGFSYEIIDEEEVLEMELPASFEDYLNSLPRKNRHELRRKMRRTESLKNIYIKRMTEREELLPAIDDFISLHKESSASKAQFWEKMGMVRFFRELTIQLGPKGWFELNHLYAENVLVAALLNFTYTNEILFYNSAFSTRFAEYNPGFYLFNRSIQQAVAEKKKKADFLRGGEKYKYYFGGKKSKIFSLILTPREQ